MDYDKEVTAIFDPVGIEERDKHVLPGSLVLYQNHPNPFNPSTTIAFEIPDGTGTTPSNVSGPGLSGSGGSRRAVSLVVYDIRGRRVRSLIESELRPGKHRVHWDGRNDRGVPVSSGIYLYTLRVKGVTTTRMMKVIR
jgi:hypothetical protein